MIEKILERLEEEREIAYADFYEYLMKYELDKDFDEDDDWFYKGLIRAKKIVQELAKDGGWIPCSERLPEISNSYLVTKMCENDENPIYETAHEIFWTIDGKWDCERDEYCEWKVIAWQNKLAPYKKGE